MTIDPRVISADNPLASIGDLTYAVEHNPNCPKPFKVRLVGDAGMLDLVRSGPFSAQHTRDLLGYGVTLQEAVVEAVAKHEERMAASATRFRPGEKPRLVHVA